MHSISCSTWRANSPSRRSSRRTPPCPTRSPSSPPSNIWRSATTPIRRSGTTRRPALRSSRCTAALSSPRRCRSPSSRTARHANSSTTATPSISASCSRPSICPTSASPACGCCTPATTRVGANSPSSRARRFFAASLAARATASTRAACRSAPATAQGEEFPLFRALWIEKPSPASDALTIHALLDSASLTGAFHFTLRPGEATIIDTELTLVARVAVDHLGLSPMTATYRLRAARPSPP